MQQRFYGFLDKLAEFGNGKFSPLIREYSKLAVNVLSGTPKILDLIKKNFFELYLAQKKEKVGQKFFSAYCRTFWDSLTLSLPKGFHKQDQLCI